MRISPPPLNATRRCFLQSASAISLAALAPGSLFAQSPTAFDRLLILIELKGANDGLNTVVPFADPAYYALRPRIGIKREEVLTISDRQGLHPSLKPLHDLWNARELAVIEGVGYAQPNLSHFRSIEIWDTASNPQETLQDGWLARLFGHSPVPIGFAADGVMVGGNDMGPLLAGNQATRSVAISNPEQFLQRARLVEREKPVAAPSAALAHILRVEGNVLAAAQKLNARHNFQTSFPAGDFGNQVRTAAQVAAQTRQAGGGVAVLRLSLAGFDTHQNQPGTHAVLLKTLAEGILALKAALTEIGLWEKSLVLTYCEFGRRARENQSMGTDHGTANVHFAIGGRVRSGLYGQMPNLTRLDGAGNLVHHIDFRQVYATVIERWWGLGGDASRAALGGRFQAMDWLLT